MEELWSKFYDEILVIRWQEWMSSIAQVLSVWYAKKNNILVYPTGIVGVLLASWVYFFIAQPPLYADGTLNVYYFVMSLYGWYNWVMKKEETLAYPVSWCHPMERIKGIFLFLILWALIYLLLTKFTNSDTTVMDSLVSSSACTAMWWMAQRKIENWIAWIFSNIVAIPLNFYKGFMLFTLMYILFLGLAWAGYVEWKKIHERNHNKSI